MLPAAPQALIAGLAAGTVLSFSALTALAPATGSRPAAEASSQLALTGLGGLLGGVAGLAAVRRRHRGDAAAAAAAPRGRRELVVSRKQPETPEITSFELRPLDGQPLPAFLPGQFLTVELTIPGQAKPVLRTYSLSDWPADPGLPDHYRLSIKRQAAPAGSDLPPGLASSYLHDHVQQGTRLRVLPPAGSFVLDTTADTPIALISNGVGITPMLAMLKAALAQPRPRPIWFIHGCRDSRFHAFREEVQKLAQQHPDRLRVHVAYSRPQPGDDGLFQSQGRVDGALIQRLVGVSAQYYLCGSAGFMDDLIQHLRHSGVEKSAIRFESFSRPSPGASEADDAGADGTSEAPVPTCQVRFVRSERLATWEAAPAEQSLLELAEAEGLKPPFACRAGVCGTCATRVLNGTVSYAATPSAAVPKGSALICIAQPGSDELSLDL